MASAPPMTAKHTLAVVKLPLDRRRGSSKPIVVSARGLDDGEEGVDDDAGEIWGGEEQEGGGGDDNDSGGEEEVAGFGLGEGDAPAPGFVRLVPSLFSAPPVVFFDYHRELGIRRNLPHFTCALGANRLKYKLYWERNVVKGPFQQAGCARTAAVSEMSVSWTKHLPPASLKVGFV